jgi:hypothetical protein
LFPARQPSRGFPTFHRLEGMISAPRRVTPPIFKWPFTRACSPYKPFKRKVHSEPCFSEIDLGRRAA